MASSSSPISTVLKITKVSPPPSTLENNWLALTYLDMVWLLKPPTHELWFYEFPGLTRTHFMNTILPALNRSLSIALQHYFPYAGNLVIYLTSPTKKPEIRYLQGDHVKVTFSECDLDFKNLTGNQPRNCDKFYHLISPLGQWVKTSDYAKIPVFSVQVTLFPNHGISLGMTTHHSIADATTELAFYKAWASISKCGTDELFLASGTYPIYDRLISDPAQDEDILKKINIVETLNQELYQPPHLSGSTDKVRATFIMTPNMVSKLKRLVSTKHPSDLAYVSSLTVTYAYIWSCLAKSSKSELEILLFGVSCRGTRMDPPIPETYFGNCIKPCINIATTALVINEGFVAIAKLLGDNLHKMLTTEGGIVMAKPPFSEVKSRKITGISGSTKHDFYDLNFGWGNPKKFEMVSMDHEGSVFVTPSRDSKQDLEIGICLSPTEMQAFVRIFFQGMQVEWPHIASNI